MLSASHEKCLCSYEFASYLAGTVYGGEKARIRKHLSNCSSCFELYISTFNQSHEDWMSQSSTFSFAPAFAIS